MRNRWILTLVTLFVLISSLPALAAGRPQDTAALTWLRGLQQADGGFSNGFSPASDLGATAEVILAAAAAGQDCSTWRAAGPSPLDYLTAQVQQGQVKSAAALSRVILAAHATGQDPRAFGGRDMVAALLATQDRQSGQFGDSLYAHAYAVLALHNAGAAVPPSAVTLLKSRLAQDGAWTLFGETTPGAADTNTTTVVMQALWAVGERDAARAALPYLRRVQNTDGGFPYQKPSAWGSETDANSTALVLQALSALGEPLGEWLSQGTDPLGALLALWDAPSGGYRWQAAVAAPNVMATAQALQASAGMNLVQLAVVGASVPPDGSTLPSAGTVQQAPIPLLPETGAQTWPGNPAILAGALLLGTGLWLRRRAA